MMVRTSYNMAKQTGMGPAGFLWLNPAQSGLALTGAYQQLGLGAYQAWGRGDISTQGRLATDLMTAAAGSTMGNQVGLALRLAGQAPGLFGDNTMAGQYLKAAASERAVSDERFSRQSFLGEQSQVAVDRAVVGIVGLGGRYKIGPG